MAATNLASDMFEPSLLKAASELLPADQRTPVLVCGMAGARNRWRETSYLPIPCAPLAVSRHAEPVNSSSELLAVHILPGLAQASPCDVMRGEETQIAGLLAREPDFAGVLCLPGTHTKWVRIKDARIVAFKTVMSGELYHLTSAQSVLRRSVASAEWDEDAFVEALAAARAEPEQITASLFSIRAESLLRDLSEAVARARLAGYWLGLELAATQEYWAEQQVTIIAEDLLCRQYGLALSTVKVRSRAFAASDMSLAGLQACYHARTDGR